MTNHMQHKASSEVSETAQNAVSLSPDILAIIKETQEGAMEEMANLGSYGEIGRMSIRQRYTIDDVIVQLESMEADDDSHTYEMMLKILKEKKNLDSLIKDRKYLLNPFELRGNKTTCPDKKIELIKRILDVGLKLGIPLEGGEYIANFTRVQANNINEHVLTSWRMKRLATYINQLVKIYSNHYMPDEIGLYFLELIEELEHSQETTLSEYCPILRLGGDVDFPSANTGNLLMHLVRTEKWGLASLALKAGADPDIKGFFGKSPLDYVEESMTQGNKGVLTFNFYDQINKQSNRIKKLKEVCEIIKKAGFEEFGHNIKRSLNLEVRDDDLDTIFMKAVKGKHYDLIDALWQAGADVCALDINFDTPLISTIKRGDVETAEQLVEIMTIDQLEIQDKEERTALSYSEKTKKGKNLAKQIRMKIFEVRNK